MANNKGVLFVSAEMDKETLANRMISALSLIPYDELHNARMSSGVLNDFTNAQAAYAKLPIWIEPKQKPTLSEVRTYFRKAERKFKKVGLGCIVIDYLQLLRNPSQRDRIQEVACLPSPRWFRRNTPNITPEHMSLPSPRWFRRLTAKRNKWFLSLPSPRWFRSTNAIKIKPSAGLPSPRWFRRLLTQHITNITRLPSPRWFRSELGSYFLMIFQCLGIVVYLGYPT